MGWARFDDGYTDSPKIVEAGVFAELLDMRGIIYSAKHETDGLITHSALKLISRDIPRPLEKVHALEQVGRWFPNEGGGWWIHDYLEYNPSKAAKSEMRSAARERQAKYRRNAVTNTVTDGVSNKLLLRGGESLQPKKQGVRTVLRCETCGLLDIDCECVA